MKSFVLYIASLVAALAIAGFAMAAAPAPDGPDQWMGRLDSVEAMLAASATTPDQAETGRNELAKIRELAQKFRARAADQQAEIELLVTALGPQPTGEVKEDPSIVEKRKLYGADLALAKAQVQNADLVLARVEALAERISERWRFWAWGRMTKVFPAPWSLPVIKAAGADAVRIAGLLSQKLAMPNDAESGTGLLIDTAGFAALISAVVGLALAAWMLARFPKRGISKPTYGRRLSAAIARVNAFALLPGAWGAGLGYWIATNGIAGLTAAQSALLGNGMMYGALALVTVTFPATIFSPGDSAWRLLPVTTARAHVVVRGIGLLGAFTALDFFVIKAVLLVSNPSDALVSSYSAVVYTLLAAFTAWLVHTRAAETDLHVGDIESRDLDLPYSPSKWRGLVAFLIFVPLFVGVIALWIGYTLMGTYLVSSVIISGLTVGTLRGLRDLFSASLGLVLERRALAANGGVSSPNSPERSTTAFWVQLGIDSIFILIGLLTVAVIWGVPPAELAFWAEKATGSFKIGSVRIAPADIIFGALTFAAVLAMFRHVQGLLEHSLLPRTRIDSGARQSIVTGTGYLGMGLAALVSISVVGIDLSNIAILAGALSVGIGFGLQNVTNNFVSGLILLFERPVKVGDWVVVGTTEGIIKHINVRSTEIETFDLASVIIPNAELLSHALTNWTHKDRRGRVEIKISVHPDSDPDLVSAVLLGVAQANDHIVTEPPPWVTLAHIQPGSLDFSLRGFTDDVLQRGIIASELRVALVKELRAHGIELAAPALGQSIGPLLRETPGQNLPAKS